jgi:hypothetical protein
VFKRLKDIFKETLKEILNKFKENGFINLLKTAFKESIAYAERG